MYVIVGIPPRDGVHGFTLVVKYRHRTKYIVPCIFTSNSRHFAFSTMGTDLGVNRHLQ